MSDQQNEAPNPEFLAGVEEITPNELPGARLAAQRQVKGWSVEHVAGQLKLAIRQVHALEADNYALLPGPVIVRGFVRSYAKLLGLDGNVLAASLPQEERSVREPIVPQRTLSTPFSESPLPLGNRSKVSPGVVIGVILAVLLVGVASLAHRTDLFDQVPQLAWLTGESSITSDAAVVPGEAQSSSPEIPAAAEANAAEKRPASVANATDSTVAQATARGASITAGSAPATASPDVASTAASAPSTSLAAGNLTVSKSKDLLRLTFHEDSWVEIRRGDQSTMISRLLKAGTTESFDITEPVTLIVGNVAGVEANLRGVKLDLLGNAHSNVARLTLE